MALAGFIPVMAACSSKSTDSSDSTKIANDSEKSRLAKGGREPRPGKSGVGHPIDKSGDATLQKMIKELMPKFAKLEFKDSMTGITMKYNLFTPANMKPGKKYPLVLFIADAGTPGQISICR